MVALGGMAVEAGAWVVVAALEQGGKVAQVRWAAVMNQKSKTWVWSRGWLPERMLVDRGMANARLLLLLLSSSFCMYRRCCRSL